MWPDVRRQSNVVDNDVSFTPGVSESAAQDAMRFDCYDIVNEADLQNAVSMLAAAAGTEKGQGQPSKRVARFRRASK